MKGFRNFLAQGNVVDLAVAFVIGAPFATVVMAFVNDIVNPLIAIPGGKALRILHSVGDTRAVHELLMSCHAQYLLLSKPASFRSPDPRGPTRRSRAPERAPTGS